MASTFVKLDIHLIFHVKTTSTLIRQDDLASLFAYMGGIIRSLNGTPYIIGGMPNHIHILTSLPKTMSMSDFVKKIKIDTSLWIKTINPSYRTFAWQDGYAAFSVSASILEKTKTYIQNQAEHHRKRTFKEEVIMFLEKHGVPYDKQYLFPE
jgi:REP element-mobilizing transposase RayT